MGLVILLSGVGLGIAGTLVYQELTKQPNQRPPFMRDRASRNKTLEDYFIQTMRLTPEQVPLLKEKLEKSHKVFESIREEFVPKMQAETDRFSKDFASILTEEQQAIWSEEVKNFRNRFFPHRDKGDRGERGERGNRGEFGRPDGERGGDSGQTPPPPMPTPPPPPGAI